MLKLLTAPVTNERSPRYMERALAAIHQAQRHGKAITLLYGTAADRVALFVEFADHLEELVTAPIAASYPNCSFALVANLDKAPSGWRTWTAELELCPEVYPILRHAHFKEWRLCRSGERHSASRQTRGGDSVVGRNPHRSARTTTPTAGNRVRLVRNRTPRCAFPA